MLIRLQKRPTTEDSVIPSPGPDSLTDRGLLRQWFILHRLDEEMSEARRYAYPLSVVILSPMLVAGDPSADERVRVGALAARAAARSSDLIGWLDGDDILVVLPHTDHVGALAAIDRWRGEMYLQTARLGGLKWLAAAVQDARQFVTADDLLKAACNQFRGVD